MRKLMWIAIGFGASCFCFVNILLGKILWPIFLLLGTLLAAFFTASLRRRELYRAALVVLGCILGLGWSSFYYQHYLAPVMALDGVKVQATVTATDYSYETAYGSSVDGELELDGRTYKIRIYINENRELQPGDIISGEFRLRYTAPGGLETATHHAGKGILLLGYQRGEASFSPPWEERFYAAELTHAIQAILREALPGDVFPFALALLLGDSSELDYGVDTAFKISGIRHIIAVSGLHVTILYSLLSAIAFKNRYLTALLAMPVLFIFAAVAGFTPSVTRACMMVGLMILAQVFNREYDSPTALAFASLAMLVVNPLVITSVSFQLSVGCTAGILLFHAPISHWLRGKLGQTKGKTVHARLKRWFISSVSVTLGAMSLTTPLCAYYFGTVSLIGVVTNLVTLWVVNFVFNGLVVLCLVSLVSAQAAGLLGWALAWPIRYVLLASAFFARLPMAAVYTASIYIVAWLVFLYVLLGVFLVSRKKHPRQLICCAALALCVALLASWAEPLMDDVRMTVLDVGQGQSIILQSEGRTYLIDCGGDYDEEAADTAAEALLSQGISRLDGIIVTHGDADHAGGVGLLLSRIQTDLLLMAVTVPPETAEALASQTDGKVIYVQEDILLTYGDTKIQIFGPIFAANDNENSLCVLFTRENCDILVTGDRGYLGEMLLLRETTLPQVDVLVAGHHGSKYSTSEELLEAVQPQVVMISAGVDNSYGHPAEELLERLRDIGCIIRRTDLEGTIVYRR